jgi:hypothetical protein
MGDVGLDESKSLTPILTPSQKAEDRLASLELELKEKSNLLREQEDEIIRLRAKLETKAEPEPLDAIAAAHSLLTSIGASDVNSLPADESLGLASRLVSYAHGLVSPESASASGDGSATTVREEGEESRDGDDEAVRLKLLSIIERIASKDSQGEFRQPSEAIPAERLNPLELCDKVVYIYI